jgi:phage pi2 protein 07
MINADYSRLFITTDKGEEFTFTDKEKMFKFLRETVKEIFKEKHDKPFIFKGITK